MSRSKCAHLEVLPSYIKNMVHLDYFIQINFPHCKSKISFQDIALRAFLSFRTTVFFFSLHRQSTNTDQHPIMATPSEPKTPPPAYTPKDEYEWVHIATENVRHNRIYPLPTSTHHSSPPNTPSLPIPRSRTPQETLPKYDTPAAPTDTQTISPFALDLEANRPAPSSSPSRFNTPSTVLGAPTPRHTSIPLTATPLQTPKQARLALENSPYPQPQQVPSPRHRAHEDPFAFRKDQIAAARRKHCRRVLSAAVLTGLAVLVLVVVVVKVMLGARREEGGGGREGIGGSIRGRGEL